MEENKKSSKIARYLGISLFIAEIITMGIFAFGLVKFPILPVNYLIALGIICVLILLASGFLLLDTRGNKRRIFAYFCSLLISVVFVMGFIYVGKARKTFNDITNASKDQTQVNKLSIIVLKSDPARKVEDTKDYPYGFHKNVDSDKSLSMVEFLNKKLDTELDVKAYESYSGLATALSEGDIKAIIADSSIVELIEDYEDGFKEKTRILDELEFPMTTPSISVTEVPEKTPEATPSVTPEVTPEPTITPEEYEVIMPPRDNNTDLTKNYFTVYFSGVDSYGAINKRSRSDLNVVMTVNPTTKKIVLVTIPRYAYTSFPGITDGRYDLLTHAGLYGVDVSMKTLESIYGVKLDYFVRVNFSSIEKFVDIIEGIDVESPAEFTSDGSNYHFTTGINHLNGAAALAFARERKAFENGEAQKSKNQLEVIRATFNKMMNASMLTRFPSIMEAVSENFQTDLTMDQLTSIVRMQIGDGAKWDISSYLVETTPGMDYCFSYDGSELYVGYIDKESAKIAGDKMRDVMEGK